jgi:hypothetical protein
MATHRMLSGATLGAVLLLSATFPSDVIHPATATEEQPTSKPESAADEGFVPLFNGRDLQGWVNVNCHPNTFFVKNGEIITTGQPTGFLRTERMYENFILDVEWMHVNKKDIANSGIFVWGDPLPAVGTPYTRAIEVQVLINYPKVDWATNHGDVFAIHGARCVPDRPHPRGYMRCLPSEERVKGGGEWNHYRIIAKDGAIKLHVNGKEVSGVSQCIPRKGYLALESEGAECHFKNIRIKELPSSHPKPEEVAQTWQGHVSIFNGLTLEGWKTDNGQWKVSGGSLISTGNVPLRSAATYGPGELLFDWRLPANSLQRQWHLTIGDARYEVQIPAEEKADPWRRHTIRTNSQGPITFHPVTGLQLMNLFWKPSPSK